MRSRIVLTLAITCAALATSACGGRDAGSNGSVVAAFYPLAYAAERVAPGVGVSNLTATPYASDAIRETLAGQIASSVRWLDSILFLLREGVDEFEEAGPGTVLTKLAAQIRKRASAP